MTQSREPVQKVARASCQEGFAEQKDQDHGEKNKRAEDEKNLTCERAELFRKRSGEKDQSEQDERGLRNNVDKAVHYIPCKNGGRVWTALQAHSYANNVAADDRWKKQSSEKAAEITLRAGREIQLRASAVHDHAPLDDSNRVREQIHHQNNHEADGWNTGESRAQRSYGKKVKKYGEHGERRYPAKNYDPSCANLVLGLVRSDHVRPIML